jgi:hypothetical protein
VACLIAPGCTGKDSETTQEAGTNAEAGVVSAPGDYLKGLGKGRRSAVRTVDTAALNAAIQMFSVEHGRYPRDLEELVARNYIPQLPEPAKGMRLDYDPQSGRVSFVEE